jgi:hypothetical protein
MTTKPTIAATQTARKGQCVSKCETVTEEPSGDESVRELISDTRGVLER